MVATDYTFVSQLYNSRKTIIAQLKTQGYDVSSYENFSIHEVNIMIESKQLDMLLTHVENGRKTYVCYYVEKAVRPQNLHDMIDDLYHMDDKMLSETDNLMLVVKDEPNDTLNNLILNVYATNNIYINIRYLDQLQFNVLEHSMVPKHTILTPKEDEMFRKKYNIKNNSDIPEIGRFDPPAQAICLKPGEICHIIRPSKTAVVESYYRFCVNKCIKKK